MNSRPRPFHPAVLFSLASLAWVCSALAHSALEPAPRPDDWWQKRHSGMNSNVVALGRTSQVVFIGDSITQGWEGEGKAVWNRYYAHRHAINLGIGGDRTQHVLWRLDNGNLTGLKPKAAVVMIGTNNSNGEDNSVEQIAEGVAAIVRKLRESLPDMKVLLIPIFPRSENPSPQRGKVLQVNQVIQKLADDPMVLWVDFGHRFLAADGTIPRDLMPDYLHLSPKGYSIWAEALEPRLAAVIGDQPVSATAATAAATGLTGDWIATIPGPNQEPVDLPFSLRQEGEKLTGKFSRPDGRQMDITEGKVSGRDVSWTLKRDRADGTSMTYRLTGKLDQDKLGGEASTELNGAPVTIPWTARRTSTVSK